MHDEILTLRSKIFGKSEAWRGNYLAAPLLAVRMTNPLQMWNSWLALSTQAALLGWEAQRVMALRLVRIAAGGAYRHPEAAAISAFTRVFDALWRLSKNNGRRITAEESPAVTLRGSLARASG